MTIPDRSSNVSFIWRRFLQCIGIAGTCLHLSGCGLTTLQLQQATNPMGDNIPALLSAQIYHNLLAKRDDFYALPAQMVVGSGSAQISNQVIIPSATANLTGIVFDSFGLQNQNQWQQSWSILAVTDPGDLQRLDALYRYATATTADNGGTQELNDICSFVEKYSQAVISASAQAPLRLWDTVASEQLREDYNIRQPDPKTGSTDPVPRPLFGPPASLPLPPRSALEVCQKNPVGTTTYADLAPASWPVPLPAAGFVKIAGIAASTPIGFRRVTELHELATFFVKPKEFAQFQLWISGAAYNTVSGGKSSSGTSPSKGISGAGG